MSWLVAIPTPAWCLGTVSFRLGYVGGTLLLLLFLAGWWQLTQSAWWRALRSRRPSPRRLFDELAASHQLSASQRRTCREVAEELDYGDAANVFVRSESRAALAQRDISLAERLYGDLDTAGP